MSVSTETVLSHLECSACGKTRDAFVIQGKCECGAPLLARYDLEELGYRLQPGSIRGRSCDLWRYRELLPIEKTCSIVTLGEGMTPLLPLPGTGARIGVPKLLIKDESLVPTGTFKARGAAVGVSRAAEFGVSRIVMPTNGNAGAAWAAYGARAGIEALIAMPNGAPAVTRLECRAASADLRLVEGTINDAAASIREEAARPGSFDASTLSEPYRLEGKKTIAFELAEQLGWCTPDVVIYPTGGGVGLIAMLKAFRELDYLGWLEGDIPRFVAVQAAGCAPVVDAWSRNRRECELWTDAATVAFGINVPMPPADFMILDAIYETEGCAIAVSDQDLMSQGSHVSRDDGPLLCPEGAATVAAALQLRADGWINEDDRVVLLNTGSGLKYPDAIQTHLSGLVGKASTEGDDQSRIRTPASP